MPVSKQLQAASLDLSKLSARAKQAEDKVAASEGRAKRDLEAIVSDAKVSADSGRNRLKRIERTVGEGWSGLSDKAHDLWRYRLATSRKYNEEHRHEHDLAKAKRRADHAELDAVHAHDFALAALGVAEFAALDAGLARLEAADIEGTR